MSRKQTFAWFLSQLCNLFKRKRKVSIWRHVSGNRHHMRCINRQFYLCSTPLTACAWSYNWEL